MFRAKPSNRGCGGTGALPVYGTVGSSAVGCRAIASGPTCIGEMPAKRSRTYLGDGQMRFFSTRLLPPSCPQLWTVELFQQVARCLHPSGRLATYSCAVAVRAGMLAAGLYIGSTPPVGRPGPGTVAALTPDNLPELSQREQEHLQTRAAIPYRDPSLAASAEEILTNRQLEQQLSNLEATSAWKKRWKPKRCHSA